MSALGKPKRPTIGEFVLSSRQTSDRRFWRRILSVNITANKAFTSVREPLTLTKLFQISENMNLTILSRYKLKNGKSVIDSTRASEGTVKKELDTLSNALELP